jgi:hypothetical protein
MIVTGIQCPTCKEKIWSRHRHDCHPCRCGEVAVDGGRDYLRVTFRGKKPPKHVKVDTEAPARCPSCDTPYTDHLGLIGVCCALQAALETLDRISAMKNSPRMMRSLATATSYFIKTSLKP